VQGWQIGWVALVNVNIDAGDELQQQVVDVSGIVGLP
jgi:hypothetical protein